VHTPLQAKTNRVAESKQRAAALTNAGPEFIEDLGRRVRQVQNHPTYAAMMESLDENVGRVLAKLKALGLETNTLVIFTSDNGGLSTSEGTPTSNVPFRTGKGWPHEGGVRVPLLVKWPGVIRPGSTNATPVISTDFYPTLLQAAGLPSRPQQHLDGVSLVPVLQGGVLPERPLFWHYPHYSNQGGTPHGAMREGEWKLIEWYEDPRVELFNLRNDPGEHNDLAKQFSERAQAMRTRLESWRKQVNAALPTANPDYSANPPKGANRKRAAAGSKY